MWLEFLKNARAYYSKRDDKASDDLVWVFGDVDRCMFCEEMRIRPYSEGFSVVGVTIVGWETIPAQIKVA